MPGLLGRQVTQKPWGHEVLWALTEFYAAKILVIKDGHRLSMQHHEKKTETMLVIEGSVMIETDDGHVAMRMAYGEGAVMHLEPGTKHRLEAYAGNVKIIEVSTTELNDVVRHDDDYGRAT